MSSIFKSLGFFFFLSSSPILFSRILNTSSAHVATSFFSSYWIFFVQVMHSMHMLCLRIFICCLMVHLYWTFVCMNVVLLLIMATMWVVQWNVSRVEWKKIDYYFVFQDDGNDHPSTQWLHVIGGSLSTNVVHVRWEVWPWIVGCKV